jgi:hypothetical protein
MAYYAVVDDFRAGMPQTILAGGLKPRGVACHSTEGEGGESGALGTIQFLIDAASRNASYHELWYPKNGGFEARRIVRPDRAAHSMNPGAPWTPNERVKRILGDKAHDPNAYSYAVSIAGSTTHTVPKLINDPGFMEGARRRYRELLAQYPTLSPDPLFNHGEGQSNRSDWGPLMRPALLEDDMDWARRIKPLDPYIAVLEANSKTRDAPSLASPNEFLHPGSIEIIVIGEVTGAAYEGTNRWLVYASSTWGLGVTHESNEASRKPLSNDSALREDLRIAEAKVLAAEQTVANLKTKISAAKSALG